MNLTIQLFKGQFYGQYDKKGKLIRTYLIGDNVPCIANIFACVVYKNGTMKDDIEAIYYRQDSNFRILEKGPKIKAAYRRHLQHLFHNRYLYLKDSELPNVDKYLDNPNEYVKEQPTEMMNVSEQIRTGEYYRNKK